MRIYLSPPDVGDLEREYVNLAMSVGNTAPADPDLTAFEQEIAAITGWPGAVALSSGTAALHLALLAVGVQPGDEVLCSTFTFAASANAIRYCGAEPVFIDSEVSSWNMSPELLSDELKAARRRGKLPAAVVVVDLYGQCANFDHILPECRAFAVPVVEDAAEALSATYKARPAGALAEIGVFSFNGNKIMTTGGGGMLVTPNADVADWVRRLSTHAGQPGRNNEHAEVGFNYRLSNILAALGRAQLVRLPGMSMRRLQINALYREILADIESIDFMPVPEWSGWNGWLTCLLFDNPLMPMRVHEILMLSGIESRPLWKPMHQQPAFSKCRSRLNGTSDHLFEHGLCIPSSSRLTDDEVYEVARLIRSVALIERVTRRDS